MSASRLTRTAVSLPSASAASSMSWIWPRPWMVAWAFSVRSSFQRTGHAVLAGQGDAEQLLGVDVELASRSRRRPPGRRPASGARGCPSVSAVMILRMCGIWVAE